MSATSNVVTSPTTASKVAAVAAVLFAITLFLTVASLNIPRGATDAELLTWWQQPDNRASGLISGAFAVATAVLFAVVMNHVHNLSAAAPRWSAFARSTGAAVTATLLVSAALRGVVGHMVDELGNPLPNLDVLRYSTALNYLLLGTSVMTVLALTITAVSVVALRTGLFGSWLGYVGLGCATAILAMVTTQMGSFATPAVLLWALCLAVAIWKQPAHSATATKERS